jgi:hypothetical protein
MGNDPETQHPIEKLVDDVEFRQRNTTWPEAMVNASSADELMWKGSRRITKVHRIGVAIFGLVFVLSGISISSSFGDGWWVVIPIATGFILSAASFCGIAFEKMIHQSLQRKMNSDLTTFSPATKPSHASSYTRAEPH